MPTLESTQLLRNNDYTTTRDNSGIIVMFALEFMTFGCAALLAAAGLFLDGALGWATWGMMTGAIFSGFNILIAMGSPKTCGTSNGVATTWFTLSFFAVAVFGRGFDHIYPKENSEGSSAAITEIGALSSSASSGAASEALMIFGAVAAVVIVMAAVYLIANYLYRQHDNAMKVDSTSNVDNSNKLQLRNNAFNNHQKSPTLLNLGSTVGVGMKLDVVEPKNTDTDIKIDDFSSKAAYKI